MYSEAQREAAFRKFLRHPSRSSFTTSFTGKGAVSANRVMIATVASPDVSSQTTSSAGSRVCFDRLSSCCSRNFSPLYVAMAIEITTQYPPFVARKALLRVPRRTGPVRRGGSTLPQDRGRGGIERRRAG